MTQLHKAGLIIRDLDQKRPAWCRRIVTPKVPGLVFGPPTSKEPLAFDPRRSLPTAEFAVGRGGSDAHEGESLATAESAVDSESVADAEPSSAIAPAESAVGSDKLPQNLRKAPAKSAVDLPQNLREAPAKSADINNSLNTKGNISEEPIHTAASPTGNGSSSSDSGKLTQDRFAKWQTWAKEHAPQVLKMKVPLTAEKLADLRSKWGVALLQEVFSAMDNWEPLLKKNRNAWKTANTWCRNRQGNPQPKGKTTAPVTPARTSDSMADKILEMETKDIE